MILGIRYAAVYLSNCWIHVLVAESEVIRRSASLKSLACQSIECSQIVCSNARIALVKNVIAKLSLSWASISSCSMFRLSDLAGVWSEVLSRARWQSVIFVETLDPVGKLWRTILLWYLLRLLRKCLIELLLAVFTRGRSFIAFHSINHIRSLLRLEGCGSSNS